MEMRNCRYVFRYRCYPGRKPCPRNRLKKWRRGSGSNRRIKVLQTSPLPLGYRALDRKSYFKGDDEASLRRFFEETEAAADWSGRRDLNPRPSPWQGDALPLSYSRLVLIEYIGS